MKRVVMIDRGDHYEVIGDYSLSPRHACLSSEEWSKEFASHPSYERMRLEQKGAVAGIFPRGTGKWTKDWSARYVPPTTPSR